MKLESFYPVIPYLRLLARVASLVSLLGLGLLYFGEGLDPTHLTAVDWVGFACFPMGVVIGMGLAWRLEWAGGLLSVASLGCFYLTSSLFTNGGFPQSPAFAVFTAPAVVFLLTGWLSYQQLANLKENAESTGKTKKKKKAASKEPQ
jgi:hypothetical protein